MDIPELLSPNDAARRLGVSPGYLYKLRLTGRGPRFVKIGNRVSYDAADLAAWIAEHKHKSTSDYAPEARPENGQ